jgi:hypothetical protein
VIPRSISLTPSSSQASSAAVSASRSSPATTMKLARSRASSLIAAAVYAAAAPVCCLARSPMLSAVKRKGPPEGGPRAEFDGQGYCAPSGGEVRLPLRQVDIKPTEEQWGACTPGPAPAWLEPAMLI